MPTKVNVKGNRNLRKSSSRKSSKKSSKKDVDFAHLVNDNNPMNNGMMGMQMPGMGMQMPGMGMQMPGMGMPGMDMQGMNMPGMDMQGMNMPGMDMQGMQMMSPMMGMPMGPMMGNPIDFPSPVQNGMMLGKEQEKSVDPLHVQFMVPHNQKLNINNYGISHEQLLNNAQQTTGLSQQFNNTHMGMDNQQPQQMPQMQQAVYNATQPQ